MVIALVLLAALSMLPGNHNAAADSALPSTQAIAPPIVVPSPDYTVNPANTDAHPADDQTGEQPDCPGSGIGCFDQWGDSATNDPHLFYLPPNNSSGKLLVFFNGGSGKPNPDLPIYSFAASLGYHVIGLSYFTAGDGARINACDNDPEQQSCYEDFMREVLFGSDNCEHEKCSGLNINDHPQDAALNRLVKALEWARDNKSNVWGHYLTTDGCGGPPPTVVLTSITSNQPDNGLGDGDTNGDIQEADFETFDRSFLLRAERAGGDPLGRTYTVTYTATDASGNRTQKSATVHVPH